MKNSTILLSVLLLFFGNSFAQEEKSISFIPGYGIDTGWKSSELGEKVFLKNKYSMDQDNCKILLAQIQKQERAKVAALMSQVFIDGIWINGSKYTYVYDANSNPTEELVQNWQNDDWLNYMKDIYEYNSNGKQTGHIFQFWHDDVWDNSWKEINTYDTNGNLTEYLTQNWEVDAWVNDKKEIYTYDKNGNLKEEIGQDFENDVWMNHWKYTNSYDVNGNLTERLRETMQDDVWINYRKHTYAYDESGNQIEYILQFWSMAAWMNMTRYVFMYDASGNLTEYLQQDWYNEAWEANQRINYTYDINGNRTEKIIQRQNGLWLNYNIHTYAYDEDGNQTEYLRQDWEDDAWVNSNRSLYAYENSAPVIFNIPDMTIDSDHSLSYTVWALGTPPPSFSLVTSPVGMTINDSTGLITWTAELGTYPITVRVENVYGISEVSFVLNVDSAETTIKYNSPKPTKFSLMQNYPNPFNPSTKISYSIPRSDFVTLKIYDLLGKEIQTLISEFQQPNIYNIYFDASKLSSGIYFYRLQVGSDFMETKRMMLMR